MLGTEYAKKKKKPNNKPNPISGRQKLQNDVNLPTLD